MRAGPRRFIKRNRVDERLASIVALAAGVAAATSRPSPTGDTASDAFITFLAVGAATWAAASAPWWTLAVVAGVGLTIGFSPLGIAAGAAGFGVAAFIGASRRDHSLLRSLAAALAMVSLSWSSLEAPFGATAAIGIVNGASLFGFGLARRPSRIRRSATIGLAVVASFVLLAVGSAALAALTTRSELSDAAAAARSATVLLDSGDYAAASVRFDEAAAGFDRANEVIGGPLGLPGQVVPGLAQNLRATRELSLTASNVSREAATALRGIDLEELTVGSGQVNLEALDTLRSSLIEVERSMRALERGSATVDSPWLLDALRVEVQGLENELADNRPRLENAIDALEVAPRILGVEGRRTYMLLFTSPSEARGLGGLFGNYAEIAIEDGSLSVTSFGRTSDLNIGLRDNPQPCTGCPEEFLQQYGQYGFDSGPKRLVGPVAWSNLTMPAHFPHVAQTAQALYPVSTGREIDGVLVLDPYVLAELMNITGPIEVPELGTTVQPAAAAEFLLLDQYVLAQELDVRVEALETLGREAVQRLLESSLPNPVELSRAFGPLVEERRLLFWTDRPDEQLVLDHNGLLGSLPDLDPVDGGFSIAVTNASGNKIEAFLERSTHVTESLVDGRRELVATVQLRNTAPSSGLPPYVIGNQIGLPDGTSRLIVTFYGPPSLAILLENGTAVDPVAFTEDGWLGYRRVVELPSNGVVDFEIRFTLPDDDDTAFEPTVWEQPLRR